MLDEGQHLGRQILRAGESAVLEHAAREDREEDLDLVEPAGVLGREDELPARVLEEPVSDLPGLVGGEVVKDGDDALAGGDLPSSCSRKARKSQRLRVSEVIPDTCPWWTCSAANRLAVPLRR